MAILLFSAAAESDWNVAMESTELASIILALAVGNVFSYVSHQNAFKKSKLLGKCSQGWLSSL